jgi:hypothetical protein
VRLLDTIASADAQRSANVLVLPAFNGEAGRG